MKSKIYRGSTNINYQQGRSHADKQVPLVATGVSFEPILLYLLRPPEDDMNGDIGRYLEPITIGFGSGSVSESEKITNVLTALFKIKTYYYGETGLHNVLYASDLKVAKVELKNDVYQVDITGKVVGLGVVADAFYKLQITKVIEQYTKKYKITLNGSENAWRCALDMSGMCR
ncbi:MAG: hypothetical protein U0518_06200 [Candidatus Gracilibacteria bacterium]